MKGILGGIYIDKGVPLNEAEFMICYNGSLCLIYDGISDIFSDVEHAGDFSRYQHLKGYALGIKKETSTTKGTWEIRDSGAKHTDKYILGRGSCTPQFIASLKPFFEAMSMT